MHVKAVGIVLSPGFQILNMAMTTVFEFANHHVTDHRYELVLLSEHGGLLRSSGGMSIDTVAFGEQVFDTLIVPGHDFIAGHAEAVLQFLRNAVKTTRRIGGSCTGAFALAEAGLLDGRRATTHWYYARTLAETFPEVRLEDDRIFVADGPIWTSAGMTACIDMALTFVEKDLGPDVARSIARQLVVYHRRSGGQTQFSALLDLEPKSDRIQSALAWAADHLAEELSIERMAEVAHLSPRQFSRAFRQETGQSPARAIEQLRVEAARTLLEGGRHAIDAVARETGFGDRERMRRAFVRAFGQSPQTLRRSLRESRGGLAA
ncbi:MAG TPA: GlxA family transcriptional regulator [Luteibacter sp.]|jgi:transcriptional regulator GlxA family with amidase domain|nr:GlxA family transcriptional regulator [Luteibacter sp.]